MIDTPAHSESSERVHGHGETEALAVALKPYLAFNITTRAHRHAVAVGGIDPAGRRDGDEVVAEVHEGVHAVPRIEPVRLCDIMQNAATRIWSFTACDLVLCIVIAQSERKDTD